MSMGDGAVGHQGQRTGWRGGRRGLARTVVVGLLASAGLCVSAASAVAAIDLGTGDEAPSIAYDASTGYTYVAWPDEVSDDTVDLCVVPSGGTTCNGGSGQYKLTDPTASEKGAGPGFFGSRVLTMPSGEVVVVAYVDGASSEVLPSGYTEADGEIAWRSPANGEEFAKPGQGLANGGKLLAEARGEMPDHGALALNATSILTYGNQYPDESGATDFTLTSPAPKVTPLVDLAEEFGDNPALSQVAAVEAPTKSGEYLVVAAGNDAYTPKGCAGGSGAGTGYGVAKGTPAALQLQSAWKNDFKGIACSAEEAVPTGGEPSGGSIGVVESEGSGIHGEGEDGMYYRPFNTGTDSFSAPVSISQEEPYTLDGADDVSASDDSSGGVYAMWLDERGWELGYSGTQGASWPTPVTALSPEASDPVVAGVGGGNAESAYFANLGGGSQEYLEPFSYAQLYAAEHPAPTPVTTSPTPVSVVTAPPAATSVTTVQAGGGISGSSLTVPQGTAVSDQAIISGAAAANAGGTVTYNLYKDSKCTVAAAAGSVTGVVKGVGAPSASVRPKAGTYYWRVNYSGDGANAASASTCGGEVLVVALSVSNLGLPSSKMCLSKRAFLVHPRAPKGVKLVSVEVQINGKTVKKGRLSNHATNVSLVGLPKGTFRVGLITRSSRGKVYEEVRTFHTCVPKKHGKK
jgi:hypothetical protein